ncbi:gamma-glutamyltransferase [Ahrensia sp. R2A130]|uniref:gamma-glutamyltransferase n=1 Tax=Ahrensia sp. R2A130 TaxID=744979 RepID=UPI0001E0CA0A|nr:gamma-glutamyltransferase [Ahrensia sp. R2A130]EFL88822.1 gamma-glutamyltransferase [Ahrensia sp. R2A130]
MSFLPRKATSTLLATALAFAPLQVAHAQNAADSVAPEAATGFVARDARKPVKAKRWMVSAANPLAAAAAADVLRAGGTAADAAIATQAMLGLVEPQSSGLGGGAFLVYYDAASGELTTLDGRETAPAAATPKLFQDADGEPLSFFSAVIGGRSVGVPGTPALLLDMHKRWGKTPFADLLTPAAEMARNGFAVSPRLAGLIAGGEQALRLYKPTGAYFVPEGKPLREGIVLKNAAYATVLEKLSREGRAGFYEGEVAQGIVDTVQGFASNPGTLTLDDLKNYQVAERKPVCVTYRDHDVCGMGPPSSGALTVGQILKLIEPMDVASLGPQSPQAWRLIGDASRLAFADRGLYMADSDFVKMPTKGLLKRDYLAARAELLFREDALESVEPGEPEWDEASLLAPDESLELPSTTHFSIVDAAGNVVSMTSTIENGFGSRLITQGFLLNNELTDFSFRDMKDGKPIANRVEPGKRPRSSMSPTIVMQGGKPVIAIGSPGGSRIIGYVAKTLIAIIDWKMDVQQAISSPHLVNRFGRYDLEEGTAAETLKAPLEAIGYETEIRALTSGLHGIVISADGLSGGADPRREGVAIGE